MQAISLAHAGQEKFKRGISGELILWQANFVEIHLSNRRLRNRVAKFS